LKGKKTMGKSEFIVNEMNVINIKIKKYCHSERREESNEKVYLQALMRSFASLRMTNKK
jgi:hypothetical protein